MKAKALIKELERAVNDHYAEDVDVLIHDAATDDALPLGHAKVDVAADGAVVLYAEGTSAE